jgi:uroporphyrinogen decarboxylase
MTQSATAETSRILRACRLERNDVTPIWLMRQAGRYMPEYRKLREQHTLLEIVKTPELAREVTLQPINTFDLDAAIIFADILPPLEGMGLQLEFAKDEGPVIHNPVRGLGDVRRLADPDPEDSLWFTLEAVRITKEALAPRGLPLIGFSGAPFTLAAYAVEGAGSRNYVLVKTFMMSEPEAWHELMTKLANLAGRYLLAQARAGADLLQVFDSWAGHLSPDDYRRYVQPYSRLAIEIARDGGVPIIHFGADTGGLLEEMAVAGGDVIGVDWRIDIERAMQRLGAEFGIQGNLDPVALYAPWPELKERALRILEAAAGRPGFIFNLGHGILPTTPVENVRRLVEYVHEYRTI